MTGAMRVVAWGAATAAFGLSAPRGWATSALEQPDAAAASRPITPGDALKFGEDVVEAFRQLDNEAVGRALDVKAMMEKATEGVDAPAQVKTDFLKGAQEAMERSGPPLMAEIKPLVQAGADFRATKALDWKGQPACLVRWIDPNGGAGYVVLLLERDAKDGRIRSTDYYPLASGELVSETVRRLYLAAVTHANRGIVDRLLGKDQAFVEHLGDMNRMIANNREGKLAETLKIFDALPEALKGEKIFQLLRYGAAQGIGDDAKYLEAIQDFASRFPGDPATDFLLIDGHFMTKPPQPEKSLECVDRLDKTLGGDAYTKVLRGNILTVMKREDDALAAFQAAVAAEPDLRPAYDGLLNTALALKRFNVVAEGLDALTSVFKVEIADLSEIDEFAEFLASPEGKQWTKDRRQKTGADINARPDEQGE